MGTAPVHSMATRHAATMVQMAGPGVPSLGFTRRSVADAGSPLSRASENRARDAEAIQESPQNHIAIDARAAMAFPNRAPNAVCRMAIAAGISFPAASLAWST